MVVGMQALNLARTSQIHYDADADLCEVAEALLGRLRPPIQRGSYLAEAGDCASPKRYALIKGIFFCVV
jgi:hypothetical protein